MSKLVLDRVGVEEEEEDDDDAPVGLEELVVVVVVWLSREEAGLLPLGAEPVVVVVPIVAPCPPDPLATPARCPVLAGPTPLTAPVGPWTSRTTGDVEAVELLEGRWGCLFLEMRPP